MVFDSDNSKRIVWSQPGPGTAETHHHCEDGSVWITGSPMMPDMGWTEAKCRYGRIANGRVYPTPSWIR